MGGNASRRDGTSIAPRLLVNAGAYIRVSSPAQSYEMQRETIERAAKARGDVIAEWYAEKASAKVNARPERERLMFDARAGALGSRLYVYRLDRLSRGGILDTLRVVDDLRASAVDVVTLADGFDLNGPAADLVLAVLAWAAKMERLAINERISTARARKAEKGEAWGRPQRLSDVEVAKVQKLREQGHTVRYIAQVLRVPKTTIGRALSHKVTVETTRGGLERPKVLRARPDRP